MSTVQATNLKHGSSATNNIVLDASGNTTISGDATISGAATISGNAVVTGTLQANGVTGSVYPLVLGTAVASTSGTSIDFTGIPSWVRRVTVMFNNVSTNGTSAFLIQLGTSGGFVSTGYFSGVTYSSFNGTSTAGFILVTAATAASAHAGIATIATVGSNAWVQSGTCAREGVGVASSGGNVTLPGVLDRVRITTVNGTDVFDAGTINIMYE